MSSKSNNQSMAFEYACIIKLENRIKNYRPVNIDFVSVEAAKRAWNIQNENQKQLFLQAADAFINTLFEAELLILEYDVKDDIVTFAINKDSDAEGGDVRDIIIFRNSISWNIGLSMKHNHFAAKHSRLYRTIDFGNKWYNLPCNIFYWNDITPIFDNLKLLKEKKIAWRDVQNKEQDVYVPLLVAFITELSRAYKTDSTIPKKLISYLLGICDFYKVVAVDKKRIIEFQPFNLRGELNKNGKKLKLHF